MTASESLLPLDLEATQIEESSEKPMSPPRDTTPEQIQPPSETSMGPVVHNVSDYNYYDYEIDDDCFYSYNNSDYEDNAQPRTWNCFYWDELIPTLVVYGTTFLLGVVGNTLIVFTICRYRRMKSTTNVFLASLASADLLLLLICIPVKIAKLFSYTWTMGILLCKVVHYMQNVSAICSVLTLTAISVERYYAIVHPMKAKYICTISQAKKIILATWLASILLALPNLAIQVHMAVGPRFNLFYCTLDYDNRPLLKLYQLYMLGLILVVPTSVMVVTYSAICWEIWQVMKERHRMVTGRATHMFESIPLTKRESGGFKNENIASDDRSNNVRQVIKMLVLIVVMFVVCWGPIIVLDLLTAYHVVPEHAAGTTKHVRTVFHLMAYLNSCVNPLVYGFMSKHFRESFQKTLCRWCRGPPRRQLSVSQSRATSIRFKERDRSTMLTQLTTHSPHHL
ncbi:QRFP-like peptide receptor [Macrosteles quadrilineatus]|uniref:QRFP-like peptide receptor n=1 Tax=Macrosteles quadrilineatus TaxID=74068 RepID=UPI0023E31C5B|nr:QRFP-like peptide receptor [Macrosteles quadrilineatus]